MADLEHLNRKIEDLFSDLEIESPTFEEPETHIATFPPEAGLNLGEQQTQTGEKAIDNAGDDPLPWRAKRRLRRQPDRAVKFSLVKSLLPRLAQTRTLQNKLNIILSELGTALLIQKGCVVLFDPTNNYQTVVGEYALSPVHTPGVGIRFPMNWISDILLETGETLLIQEGHCTPQTQPIYELMKSQGIQSRAIFPVRVQGQIVGAMSLDLSEKWRHFSEEDLHLVEFVLSKTL